MHALALRPAWPVYCTRASVIPHKRNQCRRRFHSSPLLARSPASSSAPSTSASSSSSSSSSSSPSNSNSSRNDAKSSPIDENIKNQRGGAVNNAAAKTIPVDEDVSKAKREAFQNNGSGSDNKPYGIRWRRQSRRSRPSGIDNSFFKMQEWFLRRNIILHEELSGQTTPQLPHLVLENADDPQGQASLQPLAGLKEFLDTDSSSLLQSCKNLVGPFHLISDSKSETQHNRSAMLELPLFLEIYTTMAACLSISAQNSQTSFPSAKANLALYCPIEGGTSFLDSIVQSVASCLEADIIRLDAQDFAELGADFLEPDSGLAVQSIRTLGFDAYSQASEEAKPEEDEAYADDAFEEAVENNSSLTSSSSLSSSSSKPAGFSKDIAIVKVTPSFFSRLLTGNRDLQNFLQSSPFQLPGPNGQFSTSETSIMNGEEEKSELSPPTFNSRLRIFLEAVLAAVKLKRSMAKSTSSVALGESQESKGFFVPADPISTIRDEMVQRSSNIEEKSTVSSPTIDATEHTSRNTRKLIICISDFMQISGTSVGERVVQSLANLVRRKRREGEEVMIVGTSASSDFATDGMDQAQKRLHSESSGSLYRTILVTPGELSPREKEAKLVDTESPKDTKPVDHEEPNLWEELKKNRVASINTRHLQEMIVRLSPTSSTFNRLDGGLRLSQTAITQHGLDMRVLNQEETHQLAMLTIGIHNVSKHSEKLDASHVEIALALLQGSTSIRNSWEYSSQFNSALPIGLVDSMKLPGIIEAPKKVNWEKLKSNCDRYEKKLLSGIVRPEDIHTTFNQIHAPHETIDALRTLTSLSLLRPDAFKYGVLKLESIPGLLLYGPPGTGKTLMAKAVAKESGATVLSISGSEVNDMYVGESEKNVRAIFSLARKLSPCVVFIDEADSLFGTRSLSRSRSSHRDTINQFLREWDGINDMSVFLMVATNRPFDLDDAVLRRLPRRLLVDLPTQQDREAILSIHLRDEALDTSVSVSDLALHTPFYSGSDLKNLAVAAALACIREENDAATTAVANGKSDHEYPEKRILHKHHFDQAMGEISASISEDMSSLSAIKKFDEQFGDRKGRRKRNTWGFGVGEVKDDVVRVRG